MTVGVSISEVFSDWICNHVDIIPQYIYARIVNSTAANPLGHYTQRSISFPITEEDL
jgi:hypothetical protein